MKRFIRYLYEYQDGKRVRNVGFVKVEQADSSTVVHIHGKGLHLAEDKKLKVYIFYVKGGQCIGIWQGDVEHVNPAVNYRLTFTPEDTGHASVYPLIEGVILENAGRGKFAAVWDDMPVDVEKMQIWKGDPEPDLAQLAAEKSREEKEEQDVDKEVEEAGENESGESCSGDEAEVPVPEEIFEDTQELRQPPFREEREDKPELEGQGQLRCIKIQRRDIAQLKRCEWRLANNSFLLHGYYNYHHLLPILEKDQCWLGVPGIYHPREGQAAEAFGFPKFIRPDE